MAHSIPPPISASWIFWVAAAFTVLTAIAAMMLRNVIHAALSLGACFFGVAAIYVMLHAQFLAVAQVLVYVGDVTVLILFALMLTRGVVRPTLEQWGTGAWIGIPIAGVLAFIMITYLAGADRFFHPAAPAATLQSLGRYGIVEQFSQQMLSTYLLPFEVASGILLMALVGAIVLAREERADDPR